MHVTYSENILINVSLEKYEKNHVINKIIVDLACEFNTSTDAFPPPPTCHAFLSCGSYTLNRIILYSN